VYLGGACFSFAQNTLGLTVPSIATSIGRITPEFLAGFWVLFLSSNDHCAAPVARDY
jgi:hypothetical protein